MKSQSVLVDKPKYVSNETFKIPLQTPLTMITGTITDGQLVLKPQKGYQQRRTQVVLVKGLLAKLLPSMLALSRDFKRQILYIRQTLCMVRYDASIRREID